LELQEAQNRVQLRKDGFMATESFQTNILEPLRRKSLKQTSENEYNAWIQGKTMGIPTADQLRWFFEHLLRIVEPTKKPAVKFVSNSFELGMITTKRGSDARTIAYQTALRLAVPECIWQGPYGFCGPAAVAYGFAKSRPLEYARCVLSLQNNGVGCIRVEKGQGVDVRADENWNEKYVAAGAQTTQMGPADFLILHAIRRAAERHDLKSFNNDSFRIDNPGRTADATHPFEMKRLLEQAGYLNVQNKAFWNPAGSPPEKRPGIDDLIRECAGITRNPVGPVVIVLSHPWLSVNAAGAAAKFEDFNYEHDNRKPPRKEAKKLAELHWICVNRLEIQKPDITMDFMSYGAYFENQTYKYEQFKHCFYGFISADP
jgi:hypothetical protein